MRMLSNEAWFDLLEIISQQIDALLNDAGRHSQRVAEMACQIAAALGMAEDERQWVLWGARLHDVGKISLPLEILQKQGPLNEQEWQLMELHPQIGSHLVEIGCPASPVAAIVGAHQEKYNGRGYPEGLAGEQIPLGARILAVVDTYDAMTNDRPYRKACASSQAIQEIASLRGEQFDPCVVDAFLQLLPISQELSV